MILSDAMIERAVDLGEIVIDPFDRKSLNSNSYDLRLATKFLTYRPVDGILDALRENPVQEQEVSPVAGIVLCPGKIYLAHTVERAGSKQYAPMVEGRSSYGRLGLDVHISAGFGDVGFVGQWTLELRVVEPLRIYPLQRICQIYFHTVMGRVDRPYQGKYQHSTSVVASKLYTEM